MKIGICCFSAKHTASRGKSKDWLAHNQDNVSEWDDMSVRDCCFSELTMFGSFLPPAVCRRAHVLFTSFAHSGVQNILCCGVFCSSCLCCLFHRKIYDVILRFTLFLMIKLQLMLIYDTDFMTSRLFRRSFNCRYTQRMDYALCLPTLKSSKKKWWSPIIWCYMQLK
jgi:hypothetical protein